MNKEYIGQLKELFAKNIEKDNTQTLSDGLCATLRIDDSANVCVNNDKLVAIMPQKENRGLLIVSAPVKDGKLMGEMTTLYAESGSLKGMGQISDYSEVLARLKKYGKNGLEWVDDIAATTIRKDNDLSLKDVASSIEGFRNFCADKGKSKFVSFLDENIRRNTSLENEFLNLYQNITGERKEVFDFKEIYENKGKLIAVSGHDDMNPGRNSTDAWGFGKFTCISADKKNNSIIRLDVASSKGAHLSAINEMDNPELHMSLSQFKNGQWEKIIDLKEETKERVLADPNKLIEYCDRPCTFSERLKAVVSSQDKKNQKSKKLISCFLKENAPKERENSYAKENILSYALNKERVD